MTHIRDRELCWKDMWWLKAEVPNWSSDWCRRHKCLWQLKRERETQEPRLRDTIAPGFEKWQETGYQVENEEMGSQVNPCRRRGREWQQGEG